MVTEGDLVPTRLSRGCRCFAVWIDDSVAGYGWLSTKPEWIGEAQLEITPGPNEGYIWNCVTLPEHRRKGVFKSLLVGMSNVAFREGLTRVWIGSVAIPAEKALGPSGFKPALHATAMILAGVHVTRITGPDASLLAAACDVLSIRPGWYVHRSHPRRH